MYSIRIFFEKSGPAKYISHLDLMRTFERVIRRAGIPLWYTEGFNPRPFLSFAAPLSLGTVGLREAVDLRLLEPMDFGEVRDRINACTPEGLRVTDVAEPVSKSTAIEASRYVIDISADIPAAELADKTCAFLSQSEIVTTKLNKKKKLVEVDLRHHIKEYLTERTDGGVRLNITLSSGCSESCNPSLVIDALANYCGAKLDCSITRVCTLTAGLKEFA